MRSNGSPGTRQRLIDACLELVVERGFDAASVGAIESRAGLAPRSGALYQYFDSKLAVLRAGLEHHLAAVEEVELDVDVGVAGDENLRDEVAGVARWLLDELHRERMITHVMEREGDRLPELRDRMREGITERGLRIATRFLDRWGIEKLGGEPVDRDALAVLMVGALVNVRRSTWTFGAPPLRVDDQRIIDTFVDLVITLADSPSAGGS